MNIKYIGNDTKKSQNGKIHVQNGSYTGCDARIEEEPKYLEDFLPWNPEVQAFCKKAEE